MKPRHTRKPLRDEAPKVRRPPGSPTKSQLRAIANAEALAHTEKWKTLLGVAGSTWSKIDPIELSRSNGNVSVLAGLVQMRYQIGRQDADNQVKAFFEQHSLQQAAPAN